MAGALLPRSASWSGRTFARGGQVFPSRWCCMLRMPTVARSQRRGRMSGKAMPRAIPPVLPVRAGTGRSTPGGRPSCAEFRSPARMGGMVPDDLPGGDRGRTPHVPFRVTLQDRRGLTSQLFFPDGTSEAIFREVKPYVTRAAAQDMDNHRDRITCFGRGGPPALSMRWSCAAISRILTRATLPGTRKSSTDLRHRRSEVAFRPMLAATDPALPGHGARAAFPEDRIKWHPGECGASGPAPLALAFSRTPPGSAAAVPPAGAGPGCRKAGAGAGAAFPGGGIRPWLRHSRTDAGRRHTLRPPAPAAARSAARRS